MATLALTAATTALTAMSTLAEGNMAAAGHRSQQQIYEKQATEARAVGSQRAAEADRQMRIAMSNAVAKGASQGGATDPGMLDLFGDIAAEGAINVGTEVAMGENRAQNFDYSASVEAMNRKNVKKMAKLNAVGDILSGASTMYDQFGSAGGGSGGGSFYYG